MINAGDFAIGDGVTDVAARLQAVIDAAYAAGGTKAVVDLPVGTYIIGSALNVKCQLTGVGTIKTKTGNTQLQTLIIPPGYDGAGIRGITFDGNLAGTLGGGYTGGTYGILIYSNNCIIQQVQVRNTRGPGIYAENISSLQILFPNIKTCKSKENSGFYGDGIIIISASGQTKDVLIVGAIIDDVQRIGITVEGDATWKTQRVKIAFNLIMNAANANTGPDAAGQMNAGIWCENTSSATLIGNTCTSTGIGIYVNPIVGTLENAFDLIGNEIVNQPLYGIVIGGASQNMRCRVSGGSIRGVSGSAAVYLTNAGGEVTLDGSHFGSMTYSNNNHGLVDVDQTGATYPLKCLTIQNCTKETNNYFGDAADINIISGSSNLVVLQVLDCSGTWKMAMRNFSDVTKVRNTDIQRPSATYLPINAVQAGFTKERTIKLVTATPSTWLARTMGFRSVSRAPLRSCCRVAQEQRAYLAVASF